MDWLFTTAGSARLFVTPLVQSSATVISPPLTVIHVTVSKLYCITKSLGPVLDDLCFDDNCIPVYHCVESSTIQYFIPDQLVHVVALTESPDAHAVKEIEETHPTPVNWDILILLIDHSSAVYGNQDHCLVVSSKLNLTTVSARLNDHTKRVLTTNQRNIFLIFQYIIIEYKR